MSSPVLEVAPLGTPWPTVDPFLFCVHHVDDYPAGNERMGPAASLAGRDLGQDFAGLDGWRMYHGRTVPGFPQHPHRGFETVTYVRRGVIDHSDSMGAAARFGRGDVQWMTAGGGVVHAEMFPLLDRAAPNPVELFQIWVNLPAADKLVVPHFAMLWDERIPRLVQTDDLGRTAEVTVIAGSLGSLAPPAPPGTARGSAATWLTLGSDDGAELLVLQGRPIAEPVAQYGPFVMNQRAEIQRAVADYRRTGFGGWPWPTDDPVHGPDRGRFARHVDGRVEEPAAG